MRFDILKLIGKNSKRYANLPDSYIKRKMERIYWKTPGWPRHLPKTHQKKKFYFGLERPWTNEFRMLNPASEIPKHEHVEPILNWSFFRGDRVEILTGPDKGKQGVVSVIYEEKNWVIVEGLNTIIDFVGKNKDFPGIPMRKEMPLLVTEDIQLVDPQDLKATKVEWRYTEEGEKVRVSLRTGRVIPIPPSHYETIDYKLPRSYKENDEKDTLKAIVEKVTFKPELKTFEMDIMEKMGIKEDRVQKPTYWY
ncbi:probable 39S ribosomal protein L24, mitochondrial [Copidosoma floridanum]|uniref:probable 39S ribosomal protein L24, mitochondrial n=1 Tax=Copidosoma floridanum TaxID=29053 RepID=UPI0006C9AF19|nr:probable 39S ribosomal protein L24, mitochondrial [Copidosoma floridanum]